MDEILIQSITFNVFRHSKEEYRCTLCPYTCTTEKAYIRHLRLCESKESIPQKLPLSCPICGKDRAGKQILALHMEKHKDNKHFCCDICSFRTIQLKKVGTTITLTIRLIKYCVLFLQVIRIFELIISVNSASSNAYRRKTSFMPFLQLSLIT